MKSMPVSHKNRILITAAGSELAFGIIKACRKFSFPVHLIGCDMDKEVLGKYWCDEFSFVPPASSCAEYLDSLISLIYVKGIKIIIPTADSEFPILSRQKKLFLARYNCHILVNNAKEIDIFCNKWSSYKWFNRMNIPSPRTLKADNLADIKTAINRWSYPMILKPCEGGGSRFIKKVYSWYDIERFQPTIPDPVIQEYLLPDNEEYTAGTYRCLRGNIYVIILKRTLKFGMTYKAQTVINASLEQFCRDIILKTGLIGSNNIQFRLTSNGPMVIEINPRFSGAVAIRATLGFNDVEMWISDLLYPETGLQPPKIKQGKVFRYMNEEYILKS